jgi:hypothetical protein
VRRRKGGCCCLDGLELESESSGLTMTRGEVKSGEREGSEPWGFALCVWCVKLDDCFGSGLGTRSARITLRVGPARSMRFVRVFYFDLLFSETPLGLFLDSQMLI